MSATLNPSKRPYEQNLKVPNGKGKWQKTSSFGSPTQKLRSSPGPVIFRLLCPASRICGITGEGDAVISQICQETGTKVIVEESVPGCDERVVVISGSDKESEATTKQIKEDGDEKANVAEEDGNGKDCHGDNEKDSHGSNENMENVPGKDSESLNLASSLQKAILLVFERMVEAEPEGEGGEEENEKSSACTLRLLVLSSQVGCVLGKGGSVIKQISSESGAQIRIIPRDKLPACASSVDDIVQITGEVDGVRKALHSVSQQILENPPKDQDSVPPGTTGLSGRPPRSEVYPPAHHSFAARATSYVPVTREFIESGVPGQLKPGLDMLTFRLLCHDERVGGVIGKGGTIIKTLKQETGCEIKVLEGVTDSEDRIIVISGLARPHDRISPAQEAVLRVQTRIFRALSESKEKNVAARILVSSHQIGCLLGKGGSIMAEMRKSSGAHIRILGKDQIPKCASETEEVVQINGEHEVVQAALLQITTRLRHHFFRDVFPSIDHLSNPPYLDQMPPFPTFLGRRELSPPFHSFHNFDSVSAPPSHVGFHPHDDHSPFIHNVRRPGMLAPFLERKQWGPRDPTESGPVGLADFPHRRTSGFVGVSHSPVITNTTVEVVVPCSVVPVIYGEDGACLKQIRQISDAKITIMDPKPGAIETMIIISGTPEQTHAAQSLIQAFVMSEKESS